MDIKTVTKYLRRLSDKQKDALSGESMKEHIYEIQNFINQQADIIDLLKNCQNCIYDCDMLIRDSCEEWKANN